MNCKISLPFPHFKWLFIIKTSFFNYSQTIIPSKWLWIYQSHICKLRINNRIREGLGRNELYLKGNRKVRASWFKGDSSLTECSWPIRVFKVILMYIIIIKNWIIGQCNSRVFIGLANSRSWNNCLLYIRLTMKTLIYRDW